MVKKNTQGHNILLDTNTQTTDIQLTDNKKIKTKIHITVIRCKTTIIPKKKLKEEQLQN